MSCNRCIDIHTAQLTGKSNLPCYCNCHDQVKRNPDVSPTVKIPIIPIIQKPFPPIKKRKPYKDDFPYGSKIKKKGIYF